ncbi:uncharacterized protein LOC108166684 isoform X2 [Poecilia reticulata]|uniref:uncharacterized protein LOC108166684 isoform X2 n=1 Tax=Poecilia reticulata TaxID=8081 RepID=UPI0007EC0D85|nr:PREDICTED: uncharacterized protein LOC108166684 isoform X2 [Poecilia reticulata]
MKIKLSDVSSSSFVIFENRQDGSVAVETDVLLAAGHWTKVDQRWGQLQRRQDRDRCIMGRCSGQKVTSRRRGCRTEPAANATSSIRGRKENLHADGGGGEDEDAVSSQLLPQEGDNMQHRERRRVPFKGWEEGGSRMTGGCWWGRKSIQALTKERSTQDHSSHQVSNQP